VKAAGPPRNSHAFLMGRIDVTGPIRKNVPGPERIGPGLAEFSGWQEESSWSMEAPALAVYELQKTRRRSNSL